MRRFPVIWSILRRAWLHKGPTFLNVVAILIATGHLAAQISTSLVLSNSARPLPQQGFSFPVPCRDVGAPEAIALGGFNGDGKADLALANSANNKVSILLNNGNGTFQPPVNYAAGYAPG
jgi:FG-GAP-like repeat